MASYLCCRPGTAGVPAGDDNNVNAETVIEEIYTTYDRGGNVTETRLSKRLDDATGTGALSGPNTQPKCRTTYTTFYPDAIGRARVTADYGTAGGVWHGRPEVAPARSDTVLVTTNRYKDSGDANAIIDPEGIETRWENDKAGRRIKLEEGRPPGLPTANGLSSPSSSPCNQDGCTTLPRITEFVWHSSGQLEKLILVNADTGNQITRWVYGTTLADSAIASNGLVRAKVYPESDDRPAPAVDGPDGVYARLEYQYNRQGQQTQFKDADGTTHQYVYNKLGRMTEDKVTTLAPSLNGDVRRIGYSYDNRNLTAKVTSYNAASGGSVLNEAAFEYDSFLQLSADKQSHSGAVTGSTPKVSYTYETGTAKNSIRRLTTTYPNGRVLNAQYGAANSIDDHLSRVSALQVNGESANLVDYTYCGAAWQVRVAYPQPGVELTYKKLPGAPTGDAGDMYSGYDRFGRSIDLPWIGEAGGMNSYAIVGNHSVNRADHLGLEPLTPFNMSPPLSPHGGGPSVYGPPPWNNPAPTPMPTPPSPTPAPPTSPSPTAPRPSPPPNAPKRQRQGPRCTYVCPLVGDDPENCYYSNCRADGFGSPICPGSVTILEPVDLGPMRPCEPCDEYYNLTVQWCYDDNNKLYVCE